MNETLHYSILIQWSDEDQRYVVILPEWEGLYAMPVGDGKTYQKAAQSAKGALETFIELAKEDGIPLPEPRTFAMA